MIYQYRYKKFKTLKAAQNYINTLLMTYTCIDADSVAIKEIEKGFIARLQIEAIEGLENSEGNLIELCTLVFNGDDTINVVPHPLEDIQKGKAYPTLHLATDPEEPLKKLVGIDGESYLYDCAFSFCRNLTEKGFIIDKYSSYELSHILVPSEYSEYIREKNMAAKNKSLFR